MIPSHPSFTYTSPLLTEITNPNYLKQQEEFPSSFFNFPSPFVDDLLHFEAPCNESKGTTNLVQQTRSSKRDRHSKINTARGPRDRRMRLSLEIARQFFDLQDILGFDKASKTVEWLLKRSKSAIKELYKKGLDPQMSSSSISESEVASCKEKPSTSVNAKEKKIRKTRLTAFDPLARESREKARARARERTKKKLSSKPDDGMKAVAEGSTQMGSWSSLETGEDSASQSNNMKAASIEESSFAINGVDWSPSSIFYQHTAEISHEHQFTDYYPFNGKVWEAYLNLC